MKKIILSESQSVKLASMLKDGQTVQKMPVDKKMNKPYCIDPEKVLVVKKFLDNGFVARDYENVGANGLPCKTKIIQMNASNGEPLKYLYQHQMVDLLIDKFQNMFLDKLERELFMKQVLKDWLNNRISVHGLLSVNALNESTVTSDMVDERAAETNTEPTDGQKEAGNYKMGHISIKGMKISIENPKGSVRRGKDGDGKEWERVMKNHYGYFTNTTGNGKDGDAVDVFIGPHTDDFERVYVIDQKVDGKFDESKVMIGFYSKEEAKDAYLSNYDSDWNGFWKITGVSIRTFRRWLYRDQKQRKPFFDYVTIRKHKVEEGRMNEEEYNEVKKVATMFDEKGAVEVAEELNAKGIESYNDGRAVYAVIERDRLCPAYVDEVLEFARKIAVEYMETHQDSMATVNINEDLASMFNIDGVKPIDLWRHEQQRNDDLKRLTGKSPLGEPSFDGWKRVRGNHGKMNLQNEETGELISDKWFDWIGYLIDGYAIVSINDLGYNIIDENGELILPSWHEDIDEPYLTKDSDGCYIIHDGNKTQKIDLKSKKTQD